MLMRRLMLVAAVVLGALGAVPAGAQAGSIPRYAPTAATARDAVSVVADTEAVQSPSTTMLRPGKAPETQAVGYPLPYLGTIYGPIAQATEVSGGVGRVGFYSPLTGEFNPQGGWLTVEAVGWYSWNAGTIRGWTSLRTAYGPVVYATQYSGGMGRWGNVNLITGLFYPGGDWLPVA